jgi:hypothetical protein
VKILFNHRYAKMLSESIRSITNYVLANQHLLKFLAYDEFDPLIKPDLTNKEKQDLLGKRIIPGPSMSADVSQIRFYFKQGEQEEKHEYKMQLVIEFIVPDHLLYTAYGQRNWLMCHKFLESLHLLVFKHIGKPDFKKFEQKATMSKGVSSLVIMGQVDIVKFP